MNRLPLLHRLTRPTGTIRLVPVDSRRRLRAFFDVVHAVYAGNPHHRSTEDDVVRMLVEKKTAFASHAAIDPFLIVRDGRVVGRVTILQDRKLPDYVQIAHFEALPGLEGLQDLILLKARALHSKTLKVVVGLHGHLNYGAGFLVTPHDLPPVFGLPYTPRYYLDYWAGLDRKDMVSFRFGNEAFYDFAHKVGPAMDLGGIRIRHMDRRELARETDLYTWLNNACFQAHPYWADRTTTEDYELLYPFRLLLKEENLIFAEENGRPVGFLLWYPDYNELVTGEGTFGPVELARYHLGKRDGFLRHVQNPIQSVRLTEIAVHPSCRNRGVVPGMILEMIRCVEKGGYSFTEGGFIFESNRDSMSMTLRYIAKAFGKELVPARRFCLFEGTL